MDLYSAFRSEIQRRKTSSTKLLVNGESCYVHVWRQKDITLNIW